MVVGALYVVIHNHSALTLLCGIFIEGFGLHNYCMPLYCCLSSLVAVYIYYSLLLLCGVVIEEVVLKNYNIGQWYMIYVFLKQSTYSRSQSYKTNMF